MSGGKGGSNAGGAGGTGYTGQTGGNGRQALTFSNGTLYSYGGGGGGGGAGYASAGAGGVAYGGAPGGAAGTAHGVNGGNGANGSSAFTNDGGGGGGGGFAGGAGASPVYGSTYVGGGGGQGGSGISSSTNGSFTTTGAGGGGGAGGAGFYTEKALPTSFFDNAIGGNGGAGGKGGSSKVAYMGSGGDGGAGLRDGAAGASLGFAAGYLAKGGAGGAGNGAASGGAGILLANSSSAAALTNLGVVAGGRGGQNVGGTGGTGGAGVSFAASGGTLTNTGSIKGGAGGTGSAGTGAGGAGVIGAGLTVENSSSITGGMGATQADAITFQSGANTLALGGNSTISGAVDIQSGTLKFDQSALSGAPTNATLSTQITGAGAITKVGTGTLTLSDASTYKGGTTLSAGALDLGAATAAGTGAIDFGTLSGTAQATLDIDSGAQTSGGTFANTLSGFNASSVLDLKGFVVTGSSYANGTLTLTGNLNGGTQATTENYAFASPSSTAFTTTSDDAGGTDVTVCFAAGTRIRTARGDALVEVAVEDLRVGDRVVTAGGAQRPVTWLGHRTIDCRRHPNPREAMPIRVATHAFGPNRPACDLFLSPGHSVCVDLYGEVLVPVGRLANGATIAQLDVDEVTYWHVELDAHDIILAENLPSESYIDCGTRAFFAESQVVALGASPDALALTTDDYCRPFHPEGALVDFARERLCLRANDLGWRLEVTDPLAGLWLEVDGQRVVPHGDGLVARITLPAAVRDIWLCSESAVPADVHGAKDERRLGLQLASLVADDGLHWRCEMGCTDERLEEGFHPHEGALRWTDGRARLPAELWDGARDMFVLRLAFAGPALPRWVAPAHEVVAADVAA